MIKQLLYIIFCIFFLAISAHSATYYVAQSAAGGDTGANCANAKSLSWFNSNASAGDTATLCDGTFTTQIIPTNSGSSGNLIVYIADTKYAAIIQNASYGANLSGKNYITLDGLYFNDCNNRWILMTNSDYNIIQNCKFYDSHAWAGIKLYDGSNYNKFIDNVFEDAPSSGDEDGTKPADFIQLYPGANSSNYNLFEGNIFGDSRHDSIFLGKGERNVFRGNTFQNQYHTGLNLNDDGPNLIENNYFYDQGNHAGDSPIIDTPNMIGNNGIQLNGTYNIIRKNIFDNNGSGMCQETYASAGTAANYNRFYNNTMNKGVRPMWGEAVDANYMVGNVYKNNIFTNAAASTFPGDSYPEPFNLHYRDNYSGAENLFYNNCSYGQNDHRFRNYYDHTFAEVISQFPSNFPSGNITADPKYTNAAGRDFTLQSDSTLIDAGTWLTEVNDAGGGSGTSMVVDDSLYFYDGWGIPGETADYIWVDNPSSADFLVQISSINYGTHTLTLVSSQTWDDNADVYLAYSSTVGIMGAGVDIGAEEYDLVISNASPSQGDAGVSITIDPSWTNPSGENTNDGFFKVGACPCDAGDSVWTNQAHKTSYDPGILGYNTAHCWRVDIDHNGGTETGTNYGFTTTSQANPPTPEGSGMVWHKSGAAIVHHNKGLEIQ